MRVGIGRGICKDIRDGLDYRVGECRDHLCYPPFRHLLGQQLSY
jgi:hypothetical protein